VTIRYNVWLIFSLTHKAGAYLNSYQSSLEMLQGYCYTEKLLAYCRFHRIDSSFNVYHEYMHGYMHDHNHDICMSHDCNKHQL